FAQLRQPLQRRADRRNRLGPGLSILEPAHEAVRGDLGNAPATRVALLQVLDDRLGQQVVELAQAIGLQGLVGRVSGGGGHRGLLVEVKIGVGQRLNTERSQRCRTCCENINKSTGRWIFRSSGSGCEASAGVTHIGGRRLGVDFTARPAGHPSRGCLRREFACSSSPDALCPESPRWHYGSWPRELRSESRPAGEAAVAPRRFRHPSRSFHRSLTRACSELLPGANL